MKKRIYKEQDRERTAKWVLLHRDRVREYLKKYYKANKERMAALSAKRYKEKKQEISKKSKLYYEKNWEKIRARAAEYTKRTSKKNVERVARWRKLNPHKRIAQSRKREMKKRGVVVTDSATIAQWVASWRSKPRARCYWCRRTAATKECHSDHIIALANGGSHSIENLCISCANCNLSKNSKGIDRWNSQIQQPVLAL